MGPKDGCLDCVGKSDGCVLGDTDGVTDGLPLGTVDDEGCWVGDALGWELGSSDRDGARLGAMDIVGNLLGLEDGWELGGADGGSLGLSDKVGLEDGA